MERARDSDHKLTRFLTGRRFVFISVPAVPLEKTLKVSVFNAKIFHKEQKQAQRVVMCSQCLEAGHHASVCTKDVVCKACKQSGHKRGDPNCAALDPENSRKELACASGERMEEKSNDDSRRKESESGRMEGEIRDSRMSERDSGGRRRDDRESGGSRMKECESVGSRKEKRENGDSRKEVRKSGDSRREKNEDVRKKCEKRNNNTAKGNGARQDRGRQISRQPTIRSSLQLSGGSPRSRSDTPKRRRSTGDASSPETTGKQARWDSRMSHCSPLRDSDIEDREVGD